MTIADQTFTSPFDKLPEAANDQWLGAAGARWNLYTEEVIFGGTGTSNRLVFPDNDDVALTLEDAGGIEYGRMVTTDAQPVVHWNAGGEDIDYQWDTATGTHAFFIRGSDGYVGKGTDAPDNPLHVKELGTNYVVKIISAQAVAQYDDVCVLSMGHTSYETNDNAPQIVMYRSGADHDQLGFKIRVHQDVDWGVAPIDAVVIDHNGLVAVGGGTTLPLGQLHVDNPGTIAQPVIYMDQGDVSEEMMHFESAIGVGNAIEAVDGKVLTYTHYVKVTLTGGLTRYQAVGTIA